LEIFKICNTNAQKYKAAFWGHQAAADGSDAALRGETQAD
jgi:hypothetical protein